MTIRHDSATLASLRTSQIDSMVMNAKHALKNAREAFGAFAQEYGTSPTREQSKQRARLVVRIKYLERRLRAAEGEKARRFGPEPRIPRVNTREVPCYEPAPDKHGDSNRM